MKKITSQMEHIFPDLDKKIYKYFKINLISKDPNKLISKNLSKSDDYNKFFKKAKIKLKTL